MISAFPWGYVAIAASIVSASLITLLVPRPSGWSSNHLVAIGSLRGYLALGALFHHFWTASLFAQSGIWRVPDNVFFANIGPVAVQIFFFISAFLFYGKVKNGMPVRAWLILYIGRFFRIAPLYIFAALLVVLISFAEDGWSFLTPVSENVANILAWMSLGILGLPPLNGDEKTFAIIAGVTWTLRYEWLLYFSLPAISLIGLLGRRVARIAVLCALLGLSTVFSELWLLGFSTAIASAFFFGMLAEEVSQAVAASHLKGPAAAVAGLIALCLALWAPLPPFHPLQLAASLIFFLPVVADNRYLGIFHLKTSRQLGDISYSLYLLHGIVLHLILQQALSGRLILDNATWLWMPFVCGLTVIASYLTYRLIELPGIALGRAVSQRLRTPKNDSGQAVRQ